MFNGNFGVPEALVIAIILSLVGVVVAGFWLTKKSKQAGTTVISRPSGILIGLGLIWAWFSAGGMRYPLLNSYIFGELLVVVLFALLSAFCIYRFGKRKKDWNAFARWFFWTIFALSIVLLAPNK
jgi:hypothetical protein